MPELPSILEKILRTKRSRLAEVKRKRPLPELLLELGDADREIDRGRNFAETLGRKDGINIIAELKRQSPSKGLIRPDFDLAALLQAYEDGGADACSLLTEEDFFGGSLAHLNQARALSDRPLLRKDFILEAYQIYESKLAGADAVLLIAAVLDRAALKELIGLCTEIGLAALVEVHNKTELDRALEAGAQLVGINNRNLHTFTVDLNTAISLKRAIPEDRTVISESGITGPEDVRRLLAGGIHSFLIGEYFLRQADPAAAVKQLKELDR